MHPGTGPDWTDRRRFTMVAFVFAIGLLSWGAFVTSIDAGLAVPDWPSSFNSYDPFNPWPNWWEVTPILAEHGHRLLGALVGLFTLALAFWTWRSDDRLWMRRLGVGALVLVMLQGLLGGLRVVMASVPLAVVHAATAHLFFALLASMILFVSPTWLRAVERSPLHKLAPLRRVTLAVASIVYLQILFGALLRHPGVGINPILAGVHIAFAFVASGSVFYLWITTRIKYESESDLRRLTNWAFSLVIIQVCLGVLAYFVLLDERGIVRPSNLQVIVNSTHLVVGALLFASTVTIHVLVRRLTAEPRL